MSIEIRSRRDVPDVRWPSCNPWGVPTLDLGKQGRLDDGPFIRWGSVGRRSRIQGAYHFYTHDYKFSALWNDPSPIPGSGCRAVVEPNYSTAPNQPAAAALWSVFRKRWLARWWQALGIRVFVDLNIEPGFRELNLLGVPGGWRSFATRSHLGIGTDELVRDFEAGCSVAGDDSITFLVFGGGKAVRSLCDSRGWTWVPEDIDLSRGRFQDMGRGKAGKSVGSGRGPAGPIRNPPASGFSNPDRGPSKSNPNGGGKSNPGKGGGKGGKHK